MAKKSTAYIVVAKREKFALSYPRHIWEKLTPGERRAVIARQAALIDQMSQESDVLSVSKLELSRSITKCHKKTV